MDAVAQVELGQDLRTWVLAVASLTNSARATSRFDEPLASSSRTSRSRAVSLARATVRWS
jgi:hypothetical protein